MTGTVSLCITTFNRTDLLFSSYEKVIDDPRISEVVIVDDCSALPFWYSLEKVCTHPKIKLFRNQVNLGMSRNKAEAIRKATNKWCILFDSDNELEPSYLDAIPKNLAEEIIYSPNFAAPNFDFRKYTGLIVNKGNVHEYIEDKMFRCFLNCCNYLVHRERYLEVWCHNPAIKQSDTIYFNRLWMKSGGSFQFIDAEYHHRVHNGSGWLENHQENIIQAKKIEDKIRRQEW